MTVSAFGWVVWDREGVWRFLGDRLQVLRVFASKVGDAGALWMWEKVASRWEKLNGRQYQSQTLRQTTTVSKRAIAIRREWLASFAVN